MSGNRLRDAAGLVAALRAHTDNGCFACGLDNPIGLHIDGFSVEDGEVTASFVGREDLRGTIGVLHGGVAATALDEILVWAGIFFEDVLAVTGTLDLRFRRPIRPSGPVCLRARVDDRSGQRLRLSGEVEVDGAVAVSASGIYLVSVTVDEIVAHAQG